MLKVVRNVGNNGNFGFKVNHTAPPIALTFAMRGLGRKTQEIYDIKPGGSISRKILAKVDYVELSRPDSEKLAGIIFEKGSSFDSLPRSRKIVQEIVGEVGFSADFQPEEEAGVVLALAHRWPEINGLRNLPEGFRRSLVVVKDIFGASSTCRYNDDLVLLKVRKSLLGFDIRPLSDELVSALRNASEVTVLRIRDEARRAKLSKLLVHQGTPDPRAVVERYFKKENVPILYSNAIQPMISMHVFEKLNVKWISEVLTNFDLMLPLRGMIVDYCHPQHPSFIGFDRETRIVLFAMSDQAMLYRELENGGFRNLRPMKVELWDDMSREDESVRLDDSAEMADVTAVKTIIEL